MPRASFGGAGDYSQLFAALYQQHVGETERLADAAVRRNKEAQAALDSDTFDRWAKGSLTDEELMAYIAKRVEETVTDPAENAEWLKAQREYGERIADDKAESAFKAGGSVNELIAYYETKLAGVEKDTPKYREIIGRLNDLKDQRAADDVNSGLEQIMDRLEQGKAAWADVAKFYRQQLAKLRPGSPMREQLERALDDAEDKVREQKVQADFNKLDYEFQAGKISGKTYGARLRRLAEQFKTSDPARYFEILTAAAKIERGNPGLVGTGGRGGGGRGGSKKAINATIDALQGTRNSIEAVLDAYEKGARTYVDASGKTVQLTPDLIKNLDRQWLDNSESLEAAYRRKGDLSAAANVVEQRSNFIVLHAQPHNTLPREEAYEKFLTNAERMLADAANSGDPDKLARVAQRVATDHSRFTVNLTTTSQIRNGFRVPSRDIKPENQPNAEWVNGIAAFDALVQAAARGATPEELEQHLAGLEQALANTPNTGSGMAVHSRIVAAAQRLVGNQQQPGLAFTISDAITLREGIAAGTHAVIQGPTGPTIVPLKTVTYTDLQVDPTTGAVTEVEVSEAVPDIDLDPKNQRWVDIFVEVNGRIQKRRAVATVVESPLAALIATKDVKIGGVTIPKGMRVTSEVLAKAKEEEILGAFQKGSLERASIGKYLQVKGADGELWSQDPDTGQWFKGPLPYRHVPTDQFGLGTVLIDSSGKPQADYKPFTFGVPAPFSGKNAELMQEYYDKGGVSTRGLKFRDERGEVTDDPKYNPFHLSYAGPTRIRRAIDDIDEEVAGTVQDFLRNPAGTVANVFSDWFGGRAREEIRRSIQQQYLDPSKVDPKHQGLVAPFKFTPRVNASTGFVTGQQQQGGGIQALLTGLGKAIGLNIPNLAQETAKPAPKFTPPAPAKSGSGAKQASVAPRITAKPAPSSGLDLSGVTKGIAEAIALAQRQQAADKATPAKTPVVNASTGFVIGSTPTPPRTSTSSSTRTTTNRHL